MSSTEVSGYFVQVVHNGFGHWLTVTNIGAESHSDVMLWCLYPSIDTLYKSRLLHFDLHTNEIEIKVNIMNMQVQFETCDCSLFVIASVTSLAPGSRQFQAVSNEETSL